MATTIGLDTSVELMSTALLSAILRVPDSFLETHVLLARAATGTDLCPLLCVARNTLGAVTDTMDDRLRRVAAIATGSRLRSRVPLGKLSTTALQLALAHLPVSRTR